MKTNVTGMMMYYYYVCKRKLWYFCHELYMEQGNENVEIGKILDENSYNREEKHVNIDNVINIDFLKKEKILHEVKKSNKVEEASIWQVKYYLYYLQKNNVFLKAKIDYPLMKKTVEVELKENDIYVIEENLKNINIIRKEEIPPSFEKKGICRSCAYRDLCLI